MWEKKVNEHQGKQAENVFSGGYKGGAAAGERPAGFEYGKPKAGSKTEERAKAASAWVDKEIAKLISVIKEHGEHDPEEGGIVTITFGRLFVIY